MDTKLWNHLLSVARDETEMILEGLPDGLREAARGVPILFEERPSPEMADELESDDLLGLFVGVPHNLTDALDPAPPRVLLFLENIWDYAGESEDLFREEVRLTTLHELGHYLGLDEDDVEERGL